MPRHDLANGWLQGEPGSFVGIRGEITMKHAYLAAVLVSASLFMSATAASAQSYNSSPYNYQNSPYNYENSPYNYRNSPYNYNNSPYNSNATNGIYDNDGNRLGYAVRRSDGGVNFFDDDGNRTGYLPRGR
jgi:hypothetical protein